jgi:hypothetical protein
MTFIGATRKITSWRLLALQGEGGLGIHFPLLEMVITQNSSFVALVCSTFFLKMSDTLLDNPFIKLYVFHIYVHIH